MNINGTSSALENLGNGYLRVENNQFVAKQTSLIGRFVQILSQHGDTFASFPSVQKHREKNKEVIAFAERVGFSIESKNKESNAKPLTARDLKPVSLTERLLPSFEELRESTSSKVGDDFYSKNVTNGRYGNILAPSKKLIETTTGRETVALHANKVEFNVQNIKLPNTLIAMQAPTDTTLASVLRMLHEQKVEVVVDLTNQNDLRAGKTINYLEKITQGEVNDKKLNVTSQLSGEAPDNTFKSSDISIKNSGKERSIKHISFSSWPDHKAIKLDPFAELVSNVSKAVGDKTCAIHCSAGVGRTGTLMTGLMLKHLASEGSLNTYNIDQTVEMLIRQGREDRGEKFVQTADQQALLLKYAKKLIGDI